MKHLKLYLSLGALLLAYVFLRIPIKARFSAKQPAQTGPALQLALAVAKPHMTSVKRYIDTVGQCTAHQSITLVPNVSGTLIDVKRPNGGSVQKGDVLFKIDDRSFRAALQKVEAQQAINQAKHKLNVLQLQRSEGLRKGQFVSQQAYDTYQSNVAVSKAQLDLDTALHTISQIDLDDCTISAPFAGELSKAAVDAHTYLNKGMPLATLNQIQPIYVDAFLSEKHLFALLQAKRDDILVEAKLIDDPSKMQKGRLVFIGNDVEKSTGTFDIRAEFENPQREFLPGCSIDLRIFYQEILNALLVPESALHEGLNGSFVYKINAKGLAEMQSVTVEQTYDHWVVVHGLQGDEQIIADGHALLAPGMPIKIIRTIEPPASLQSL